MSRSLAPLPPDVAELLASERAAPSPGDAVASRVRSRVLASVALPVGATLAAAATEATAAAATTATVATTTAATATAATATAVISTKLITIIVTATIAIGGASTGVYLATRDPAPAHAPAPESGSVPANPN